MSEADQIQVKVSAAKIEAIRKLRPNWKQIPAVYIVNMALDLWIAEAQKE